MVQMSGETEQPGAAVLGRTQRSKRRPAVANNGGDSAKGFYVIQHRWTLERSGHGRKRRTNSRHAALAFERLEQRRFFADLISASSGLRVAIEMEIAPPQILAEVTAIVGLGDRLVHDVDQVAILAANVDVSGVCADREPCNENALDQLVRIVLDENAVLAGTRLALVPIDH